jgi:hypothetical protein
VDISVELLTPLKKPRGTVDSEKFFGGRNDFWGALKAPAVKNEVILHHVFKVLHLMKI